MEKNDSPIGESKIFGIEAEEPEDLLILHKAYNDFIEIAEDGGEEIDKD